MLATYEEEKTETGDLVGGLHKWFTPDFQDGLGFSSKPNYGNYGSPQVDHSEDNPDSEDSIDTVVSHGLAPNSRRGVAPPLQPRLPRQIGITDSSSPACHRALPHIVATTRT